MVPTGRSNDVPDLAHTVACLPPVMDLRALQSWMLAAITTGAAPDAAVHVRDAAPDRLGVYARGYSARLHGALRATFPTVLALTGDQVFALFATAYLQAHPPTSYSLFDLGAGFPDFLDDTCPANAGPAGALPASAARLDLAVRFGR